MLAKLVDFKNVDIEGRLCDDESCKTKIPCIELIDGSSSDQDINVGKELAQSGLAIYTE